MYDMCCLCVFFQAEDGIRDLVRSRGLGDVYKRQVECIGRNDGYSNRLLKSCCGGAGLTDWQQRIRNPVSYTHLTLPTSDLV